MATRFATKVVNYFGSHSVCVCVCVCVFVKLSSARSNSPTGCARYLLERS